MPGGVDIHVEGYHEARKALEDVLRAATGALPEVMEVVGQQWETEIKRRAPLLTGRLRRSYTYEVGPGGRWVEVSSNVEYAPHQEFGTIHMTGTPHVRPATQVMIPKVPRLVAEGVARAERAAARRHRSVAGAGRRLASTVSRLGR